MALRPMALRPSAIAGSALFALVALSPFFSTACTAPAQEEDDAASDSAALDGTAWAYHPSCTLAEGIRTECTVVYIPGGKYPAGKINLQAGDRLTASLLAGHAAARSRCGSEARKSST